MEEDTVQKVYNGDGLPKLVRMTLRMMSLTIRAHCNAQGLAHATFFTMARIVMLNPGVSHDGCRVDEKISLSKQHKVVS